jgi:peroxiredoxin
MGPALLALRLLLACVFLIAGLAKLADLPGSRRAVVGFGVPERLAGVVGVGLPACELAVAVALIVSVSARFGALGALVLLCAFVVAIVVALVRGAEADCHCFGQLHSAPVGWRTLARNGLLAAAAGFVVVAGWRQPGLSATRWIAGLSGGWAAAVGLAVLLVLVIGFLAWFALQLLAQNGRVIARLEAIEAALGSPDAVRASSNGGPPVALGAGLHGVGLPVGSPAPEFTLPSLEGEPVSLRSLLADARLLLLVFSDAGCGPCEALLPELAGWQREHADRLTVWAVASGDQDQNRQKAQRHGLERALLQAEREVSILYQAHGTPMALVIGADGLIASPTVGGVEAIRTLVAQATRRALAVRRVPPSNGHQNGAAPRAAPPPPDSSRVGQPAPELVLVGLDGGRVELKDLYQERTLAIFWNPGCGFCQRMLPALKAFENSPPANAPQLLVISTGDPERTREQQIHSRVGLDPEGQAMSAFDAHGTPMGVMIEHGLIASSVAAGADAVLQLAAAAPALGQAHAGTARDPDAARAERNGGRA